MKVLNISESTVYLDDINIAVVYTRRKEPFEISDQLARKSINLKFAIKTELLLDVTNGIPAELPKPKIGFVPDPESPYFQKQAILSKDGPPNTVETISTAPIYQPPAPDGPTAYELYKATGKMHVIWHGPSRDAGGYSRMNRQFMFGLAEKDVVVRHDPIPSMEDMDKATNEK